MVNGVSPVLDKVRKLLRLAQSDNANEAAAAMAAAQRLIDEHRLSTAELEASGQEPAEPMNDAGESLLEGERVPSWKMRLMVVLSRANGCAMWINRAWRAGHHSRVAQYKAVGRVSDMDALRYMLAYAVTELERLAGKQCAGRGRPYRSNWYEGAVMGIKIQLDETQAKFREESVERGCTAAIVLLDKRADEALALRTEKFGKMGKARVGSGSSQFDSNAYDAGKRAGYNMSLGTRPGLGAGSGKALPS